MNAMKNMEMMDDMQKGREEFELILLVNPVSGRHEASTMARAIADYVSACEGDRIRISILEAKTYEEAIQETKACVERLNQRQVDPERLLFVCLGGDGSHHDMTQVLAETPWALALLPFGTGNDFAKTLYGARADSEEGRKIAQYFGLLPWSEQEMKASRPQSLPATPLAALQAIKRYPIDLIRVNDSYCVNILSVGFDVGVQIRGHEMARRYPWLGSRVYDLAVIAVLFHQMDFHLRAWVEDGEEERWDFTLLAFCKGRFYGGGFQPNPRAQLRDGLIHCLLAEPMGVFRLLKGAGHYKAGAYEKIPRVGDRCFRRCHLESVDGEEFPVNVDGERLVTAKLDLEILPGALVHAFPAGLELPDAVQYPSQPTRFAPDAPPFAHLARHP